MFILTNRTLIQIILTFWAALICSNGQAAWQPKTCSLLTIDAQKEQLYGSMSVELSDEIDIKMPAIAENSAVVPISIRTSLQQVESISILVERNPEQLAAQYFLSDSFAGELVTRIKVAECSDIIVLIKAAGALYSAKRHVKVTSAGCGG